MITPLLKTALEPIARRHRRIHFLNRLTACWLVALALGGVFWFANIHIALRFAVVAIFVAAWIVARRTSAWEPDYRGIAREIETKHPELHALLATAVEQRPDPESGAFHFLQQQVIAHAVAESRKHDWLDSIPKSRWLGAGLLQAASFVALLALFSVLGKREHHHDSAKVSAKTNEAVTVTPGDATVEKGSGLVVLAKFNRDVPGEAVLVIEPQNLPAQRIPLVKNLDDPVFGGGVPEVAGDVNYRVEYSGQTTRKFSVHVFEHPQLDRADATLHFPAYTKLPEKTVPDTKRVSAVEGSKLDLNFQLNKPVKSAALVAKDGTRVPLTVDPAKPLATLRALPVNASQTYDLQLEDADGRANKVRAQFVVEALPNRRPELKIATPKGDVRVSAIEEIAFRGEAWDDFGLARYGITYTVAGQPAKDLELGRDLPADSRQQFAHLLKLEELGMKADELISWFAWAEDTGPDGKLRRTATDMYFAEVRPFEEIYKQGESEDEEGKPKPPGQGDKAEKLAQLQKQIITATWNLQRGEQAAAAATPGEKYLKDEPVIRDSQDDALKQATALAEKIEDAKSQAIIENVTREMQTSLERLTEAGKSSAPLPDALTAEQSAYNALLKLAAHEFKVTRSKSSSSSRQAKQRNQQQLDELEMKDEKKRYEKKTEAETAQNEQQREQLAVLNRLKELAQRQNDVNERVKELQTALQEAKTEQQKEEIRRQLKRLREEEQQLLADLDELRQKMEQSPQQSQLADERKQLDQTRSEAQKAAESMEKNQASQALASGTRAARDLEKMRDDFRKKTSGQFKDEMRQMRSDARELAENQQQIAEQLAQKPAKTEQRTLGGTSERENLTQQFEKQQGDFTKMTDQMKQVSEQAEAAEPLLAKELYDTLRKTTQANTAETLDQTRQLAQRGYPQQAQRFEEKARQEIDELKSGVERAAESVLGDEAEALRQARAELDTLTQQLNREIAQARPDLASNNSPNPGESPDAKSPANSASENKQPGDSEKMKDGENPKGTGEPKDSENGSPSPSKAPGTVKNSGQKSESDPSGKGAAGEKADARNETASASEKAETPDGQQPGKQGGKPSGGQPGDKGGEQPGQQTAKTGSPSGSPDSKSPGEKPGGESPSQEPGEQPGQGGKQPGQMAQSSSPKPGEGGQTPGQGGEQKSASAQAGQKQGSPKAGNRPGSRLAQLANAGQPAGSNGGGDGGNGGAWRGDSPTDAGGPLTGENFVQWSDRLRNVEEMVDDPNLRNEVARVREIAKGVRTEFKRAAKQPDWDMVQHKIGTPLVELRNRLTEELARRESKENLVPIDRDPVPGKYAERVRRYYEELGRSR